MITNEERQSIIDAVLSALRTNSALITDLTEVQSIPDGSYIELSGGKRIAAATLKSILQTAIFDDAVSPTLANESTARQEADAALSDRITAVEGAASSLATNKFDKSNIVEADGNNSDKVWSQKYATQMKNQLATKVGNINVAIGTTDDEKIVLIFTDSAGQNTNLVISKATALKAGLMSASDFATLQAHTTAIGTLNNAKVAGMEAEYFPDGLSLGVVTEGETAYLIELAVAGTIPDGYEEPVAGVMSAEQAAALEDVVLQTYPLEVTVTGNAGAHEKGQTVTPSVLLSYLRKGGSISTNDVSVLSSTLMYHDANQFYGDAITENANYNVTVEHRGSRVSIPIQYRFLNYVYGIKTTTPIRVDQVPQFIYGRQTHKAEPAEVVNDLEELSDITTYEGRLEAGESFLFCVPGTVTLVVRHADTDAPIEQCSSFVAQLPRQCNSATKDSYTCIFVPASDIDWNFKITNS